MEVRLLHAAPLELLVSGIRTCYQSGDLSDSKYTLFEDCEYCDRPLDTEWVLGEKDKALIQRIIKSGHESTLEHVQLTFDISGFSRAVLQEFSRHRIGVSPSVKSSRYTLKELKEEEPFIIPEETDDWQTDVARYKPVLRRASKYVVLTPYDFVNIRTVKALEELRQCICSDLGIPNDFAKYCMPDAYKTAGQYTFNVRSLRHLLKLRTSPNALWEFRRLCWLIIVAIPKPYLFLFEDVIHEEWNGDRT